MMSSKGLPYQDHDDTLHDAWVRVAEAYPRGFRSPVEEAKVWAQIVRNLINDKLQENRRYV